MVGIHCLILPLCKAGLVFRSGDLVCIVLRQPGVVSALRGEYLLEQIQFGRSQGRAR